MEEQAETNMQGEQWKVEEEGRGGGMGGWQAIADLTASLEELVASTCL